ncbi:MAG TPA: response regulator [Nitrososphaeraceae archaeon]|nr:response regulator [Nitrososphaeraceae archaeon]
MVRRKLANRKRLVAIVDDEKDITVLFRDALRRIKGISIFAFTNPLMALEHFTINKEQYVLVISDLRMPSLNGLELVKKIKDLNPLSRTILMTAFEIDDKLFQEYSKKEIINAFLQKPIRLDDLFVIVNNQLHTYELQKNSRVDYNN